MPKRSNEFQDLVALIQHALAPRGAKITESALVGGDAREIDILIEGDFGPYRMRVAVEAKDESRKMDSTRFESILGKYLTDGGLKVSKIVIVHGRGFTGPVIKRAKVLGIELLTLKQAEQRQWGNLVPHASRLHFRMQPYICSISFDPPILVDSNDILRDSMLICTHGHDHGSPIKRATCIVFHRWLPHNLKQFHDAEIAIQKNFGGVGHMNMTIPHKGWKLKYREKIYDLENITAHIHFANSIGEVTSTCYEMCTPDGQSKSMQHFRSEVAGKQFSFLIPNDDPHKIVLNIKDCELDPTTKKGRKRRKAIVKQKKSH